MTTQKGKLYLLPVMLGDNVSAEQVLPPYVIALFNTIQHFIVENSKTARKWIKHIAPNQIQGHLQLQELNKFTSETDFSSMILPLLQGKDMGLISDAGCPAVADPGSKIVELAHVHDIEVIPLVGPSSILLAMMGSGMNGQSFTFNGYLPIDKNERKNTLRVLEKLSQEKNQSQLFIETPYRNNQLLTDCTDYLHPQTLLCIACDLTLPTQIIKTKKISDWKKSKIDLHKRPAIFIIHKY